MKLISSIDYEICFSSPIYEEILFKICFIDNNIMVYIYLQLNKTSSSPLITHHTFETTYRAIKSALEHIVSAIKSNFLRRV